MKISEFIDPKGIKLQVALADQNDAIDQLIALHDSVGNLKDVAQFKEAILAREAKGSTAIGNGIAVPHGKSAAVAKAAVTAITCPAGVDYKALDESMIKEHINDLYFDLDGLSLSEIESKFSWFPKK